MRINKRAWEVRRVRVFHDENHERSSFPDPAGPPAFTFVAQSFGLMDLEPNGRGPLEVFAGGDSPSEAVRRLRAAVRLGRSKGGYTRLDLAGDEEDPPPPWRGGHGNARGYLKGLESGN